MVDRGAAVWVMEFLFYCPMLLFVLRAGAGCRSYAREGVVDLLRSTMLANEAQRRRAVACEAEFKYDVLSETRLTGQ